MNIFDEINNRWFRVFEQSTPEAQDSKVLEINPRTIHTDVKTLQNRIKELERNLSDAMCAHSSRFGPLLKIENGELYYRLRGLFVKLLSIYAALDFFVGLLHTDESLAKKFRKEAGEEAEKEIKEIFNDPV